MAYQVNNYNGSILTTVEDGTIDTSTDLRFVGKNYAGYGEIQNENFLHLLQNFSSSSEPPKSVDGQVWYDSSSKKLKFYDGVKYKVASGAVVSTNAPSELSAGDLWFNESSKQLYTWSGTDYVLIGPAATPETGASGAVGRTIVDSLGTPVPIVELQAGGVTLAIISKVDFIIGNINPINGFSRVKKGITLINTDGTLGVTSATSQQYFWGTASDALKLGGVSASAYLTKGDLNFDEQAWFRNDNGFYLGAAKELLVHKESQDPFFAQVGGNPLRDEDQVVLEQRQVSAPIVFRLRLNENESANILKIRPSGLYPASNASLKLGGVDGGRTRIWSEVNASNFYGILNGNVLGNTTGTHQGNVTDTAGNVAYDSENNIYYGQLGTLTERSVVYGDVYGDVRGSAQSADTIATYSPSINATASTVVIRDSSGNITANSFIGPATQADSLKVGAVYRTTSTAATPNTIAARDASGYLTAELFVGTATAARYADLAEKYLADREYEVGTVVAVGGEKEVTASSFGDLAIGVVSNNPAFMMNSELEGGTYIALKGRVPVKVTGSVKKGDRLVAGDLGYAQVAGDRLDIFAIALETSDNAGVKLIEAVIL
jgi:hypothetical protein